MNTTASEFSDSDSFGPQNDALKNFWNFWTPLHTGAKTCLRCWKCYDTDFDTVRWCTHEKPQKTTPWTRNQEATHDNQRFLQETWNPAGEKESKKHIILHAQITKLTLTTWTDWVSLDWVETLLWHQHTKNIWKRKHIILHAHDTKSTLIIRADLVSLDWCWYGLEGNAAFWCTHFLQKNNDYNVTKKR